MFSREKLPPPREIYVFGSGRQQRCPICHSPPIEKLYHRENYPP